MDDISDRLDRIEAMLEHVLKGPPPTAVGVRGAMNLTGCQSPRSQQYWFKKHGVKPYTHGKYLRADIVSAIARGAMANLSAQPR